MSKMTLKEWCDTNPEIGEQLIEEWDEEKNKELFGKDMNDFTPRSTYSAVWYCPYCKKLYRQSIRNRTLGHSHSECAYLRRKLRKGEQRHGN